MVQIPATANRRKVQSPQYWHLAGNQEQNEKKANEKLKRLAHVDDWTVEGEDYRKNERACENMYASLLQRSWGDHTDVQFNQYKWSEKGPRIFDCEELGNNRVCKDHLSSWLRNKQEDDGDP